MPGQALLDKCVLQIRKSLPARRIIGFPDAFAALVVVEKVDVPAAGHGSVSTLNDCLPLSTSASWRTAEGRRLTDADAISSPVSCRPNLPAGQQSFG
jgi:hypothetical protein